MKLLARGGTVAVLTASLLLTVGVGVSAASGRPAPSVPTGDTTCTLHNLNMHFSSTLTSTATTADITVTLSGNPLRHCSNVGTARHRVVNGHLYKLSATIPAGATCAGVLASTTTPALSGGTVKWTPAGKIAKSTGITFPAGTMSTTTDGHLQLSLSAGTVSGSFASTDAAITATSTATLADLNAACATGITNVHFSGTATL
jgi:hypothetical protein